MPRIFPPALGSMSPDEILPAKRWVSQSQAAGLRLWIRAGGRPERISREKVRQGEPKPFGHSTI
jgi:hypothetical protein